MKQEIILAITKELDLIKTIMKNTAKEDICKKTSPDYVTFMVPGWDGEEGIKVKVEPKEYGKIQVYLNGNQFASGIASDTLAGAECKNFRGLFEPSDYSFEFSFNGKTKTFYFCIIDYCSDLLLVTEQLRARILEVREWVKREGRKVENMIEFTLDTGEKIKINRKPFVIFTDGFMVDPCRLSEILTGITKTDYNGIFSENENVAFSAEGIWRIFIFSAIDFHSDFKEKIIKQLTLRIRTVRAWTESLRLEEESRA